MANDIISYHEMCLKEGTSLQRGMNFRLHGKHSVILMSVRPNAPYAERVEECSSTKDTMKTKQPSVSILS
jgi:hypothetical protein